MKRWIGLVLVLIAGTSFAQEQKPLARKVVLGNFAAEIRLADGHVDAKATIDAVKKMGGNTYFYLIWHARTDWDDLPGFCELAEKEGIDVWVYIIPWSETPLQKKSWGFSEPFRVDYIRWATEIATISLKHKNIVGYVIDDFYTNTQKDRFSVEYVAKMREAQRAINPKLKFYPLCYYPQSWGEFMERFGGLVDGVVAAYPKSRLQIGNALSYLNDEPHGASAMVDYPRYTKSQVGDRGCIWADLPVKDAKDATLSFYWDDTDNAGTPGHHFAYVKVDGKTVWQKDTAGELDDHIVDLDLSRVVAGKDKVRIEMGVMDQKEVSHYPVRVKFDDIWAVGFGTDSPRLPGKWFSRKTSGAFEVTLVEVNERVDRYQLPMIIMPAGEREQHEKRYPEKGTPAHIAKKVAMGVELARQGRVEGVVMYCTPNDEKDAVFEAVKAEFLKLKKPTRVLEDDED